MTMGIIPAYLISQPGGSVWRPTAINFTIQYLSISIAPNVPLPLTIITRLIPHTWNTRATLGITGIGGLYTAIVMMLAKLPPTAP